MRPAAMFWFWGALMAVIFTVGLLFYGFNDAAPPALFGGTVAAMAVLGALVAGFRWGDVADEDYLRAHPDISPPMPLLGISIALLAFSTEVGWWLSLIAGGMVAFGLGGLARERYAERRMLRRAIGENARLRVQEPSPSERGRP